MSSNQSDFVESRLHAASYVSGRFLTDFLQALDRRGISGFQLIGDLAIPIAEPGTPSARVAVARVEWLDFVELMKRLERELGGATELEMCGSAVDELKPAQTLRGLAGLTASPISLYRAAIRWALRRAIPGIDTTISVIDENHIEIRSRLQEGMRDCPQIFHFAAGGARALPRIVGLQDALVEAEIGPREAFYRITLPPSPTLFARARRFVRTLFSAGDVLRTLETQQLELHAEHVALQQAHAALAANQERYLTFTNAAVDVLCELDASGRIAFVSASIHDLLGYTPEQVTGSHFRLWVPTQYHPVADASFEAIRSQSRGDAMASQVVVLHAASGERVAAELSMRSFENSEGDWRMACVLRKLPRADSLSTLDTGSLPASARLAKTNPTIETSVEGLRASVGHPLALSLERLLAAIELNGKEGLGEASDDLIRASNAMTRIIDSALVAAEADYISLQWIETFKIIERVRDEVDSGLDEPEIEIHYRLDSMPAQVCAREDLLVVGLAHLIESARENASAASRIEFNVLLGRDSGGYPCVEFIVDTKTQPNGSGSAKKSSKGDLAFAIATDAAKAHDGEVLHERYEGGGETSRFRIPSPV